MARLIFILNSISHPRCHKRIRTAVKQGYEIKVYGFERKGFEMPFIQEHYSVESLSIIVEGNYFKRLLTMSKSINYIASQLEKDDILYLFGLDVAIATLWKRYKIRYIYEESDLAHTYVKNKFVRTVLERIDLGIIRNSITTIFTSEGFVKFHYENNVPKNILLIPNKLNPSVLDVQQKLKRKINPNHLNFGFVGGLRYKCVFEFAKYIGDRYPQHAFHFYGACNQKEIPLFDKLKIYPNIIFHGRFTNPYDLPGIYAQIDMVVSTYDTEYENVKYAEPNKLYESIFFNTPIIVSKGTFLEEKVKKLGIGFSIDVRDRESIDHLMDSFTDDSLQDVVNKLEVIPQSEAINDDDSMIKLLKSVLEPVL